MKSGKRSSDEHIIGVNRKQHHIFVLYSDNIMRKFDMRYGKLLDEGEFQIPGINLNHF